tara:strand:- start:2228 stop:2422 length:195 start_codon:yes stop_codon:yes gene_type:complete
MNIGDLVQSKEYLYGGYVETGIIVEGPYFERTRGTFGNKYYTVLWNNGHRARVREKEVKVISHG